MSIADDKASKWGFRIDLNPYRLVDAKSGKIVNDSKHFNLTDKGLQKLREYVDTKPGNLFKKVSQYLGQ